MANQVLYGFIGLQDVFSRRLSDVDADVIGDAIQASVDQHQADLDALMDLFVTETTAYTERYKQLGPARLQPLDENGRALPIKPFGAYDVAYPIQGGGSAWGANYIARAKMTVADANDATAQMLSADARWMRDHILAALFAPASWGFTDPDNGALTIQPLASGDSVVYALKAGADQGATDTHQLATASAIADATNPFPTIRTELMEHPENAGQAVAFVPTNLLDDTEALATFFERADANLTVGSGVTQLTGTLGQSVPGEVVGYESSGIWIVHWDSLPDDYIVAVATDGTPALGMRQHPEPQLQGFNRVADRNDHPFYESQWLRLAGFGARNRVGAVVMRVGNGTYAAPTGYTSPMA